MSNYYEARCRVYDHAEMQVEVTLEQDRVSRLWTIKFVGLRQPPGTIFRYVNDVSEIDMAFYCWDTAAELVGLQLIGDIPDEEKEDE